MQRKNTLIHILIALLLLETGALLGGILPKASATDTTPTAEGTTPEVTEAPPEASPEASPDDNALVCRHFRVPEQGQLNENEDRFGEIHTGKATGKIGSFLNEDYPEKSVVSTDFEVGQSYRGKPTYWVQICVQ